MGIGLIDGTLALTTLDFNRPGSFAPNVTRGLASGYVATSITSNISILATPYVPQGNNAQRSIVSTSINDAPANIGAITVTVSYLNTSMVLLQDVVTLNGLTPVNTNATDIAFIEAMYVTSSGSSGTNVGAIELFTGIGGTGTVWASIAASDSQTFYAHHYVPAGVTSFITNMSSGATVVPGRAAILYTGNPTLSGIPTLNLSGYFSHAGGGTQDHIFHVALPMVGPNYIFMVEQPTTITASTTNGSFEYIQF